MFPLVHKLGEMCFVWALVEKGFHCGEWNGHPGADCLGHTVAAILFGEHGGTKLSLKALLFEALELKLVTLLPVSGCVDDRILSGWCPLVHEVRRELFNLDVEDAGGGVLGGDEPAELGLANCGRDCGVKFGVVLAGFESAGRVECGGRFVVGEKVAELEK